MQLRRRLPVLLSAALVMMLSLGTLLMLHLAGQARQNRELVRNAFEVSDTARSLLSEVQNAETGQRGFILTGRETYLAPYDNALAIIPGVLAGLDRLVAEDAAQRERLARLRRLIDAKLEELRVTLEAAHSQGLRAAMEMVQTDRGRDLMEAIRTQVSALLAAQDARLDSRIAKSNTRETQNYAIALAAGGLALLVIVAGALVLFRSNARLRRAEAGLARQGAVLQATLDSIQDGVAAFDSQGLLVACNNRFFDLLGFPRALAAPGTPLSAFQAIDRRRDPPLLPAAGAAPGGLLRRHAGQELEIYRNAMAGGGFVVSCIDVTRRAEAEAILRQAQKMEAIGHLTGGVAHDFNNLLQVVSGNLDLLVRELGPGRQAGDQAADPLGEAPRRHLRNALAGVERGARLTAQLLAFARRQPLDPRVVNLGRQVREMTDLLRRTLGERVAVEAVIGGGLWNTQVDPTQLGNALLNLAINARDAMPDGGKLTIEVANAALDEAYAANHVEVEAGQYAMLAVTDTGTGMAPEVMARVFEPFFTTKPDGQGTGLGLSQVYGFVKQSGGHVKLYSEAGEGTTVKLYLPRSRKPEEAAEPDHGGPAEGGTETVLVVEDDAAVRGAVIDMLSELGYRVLRAEHAEAALTVLSSGAQVDLLFTDVVMPGPIKTRDLARRAQELIPGLKVLYTSGYTANAIIHDGRLDADVLLLSKPYRRDDLARQVRRALGPPRAAPARSPSPPVQPPAAAGWPPGSLVLVVEDDALIRMSLLQMLEAMELLPEGLGSAEEALARLHQEPVPALLVTDLGLPDMDGVALITEARRLHPALPVLLATGHAASTVEMPDALRRSIGFLGKPFGMAQLEQAVAVLWRPVGRAREASGEG
jgi:signal transduction histidine kinase/FixJ family two-component response regulator